MNTPCCRIGDAWAEALLFHPLLGDDDTARAWEGVLLEALQTASAGKLEAARALLQQRLDSLERTQPQREPAEWLAAGGFLLSTTADGICVLRTGPVAQLHQPDIRRDWETALTTLRNSAAAVLDLRQPAGSVPVAPWPDGPAPLLSLRPPERHRIHTGWPSEGRPDTGAFESGWNCTETRLPTGLPRLMVIADGRLALPSGVAALASRGLATLVTAAGLEPRWDSERVVVVGGVRIRVGEFPRWKQPESRPAPGTDPVELALSRLRSGNRPFDRGEFPQRPAGVPAPRHPDPTVRALRALLLLHRLHPYGSRPTETERETALRNLLASSPTTRITTLRRGTRPFADGHARVRTEDASDPLYGMQPPVRLRMVESQPVVTALLHPLAGELGVRLGDTVLAVDGEPAGKRLERLRGVLGAGTAHALGLYAVNRLLVGTPGKEVRLVLSGVDGRRRTAVLPRDIQLFLGGRIAERSGTAVRRIGSAAVFDADRLDPASIRSAAFVHREARRWILDLRGEARETAWTLVPLVVKSGKRIAARFVCPIHRSSAFGNGEWTRAIPLEIAPGAWSFAGELVALVDERTQSQSELAALMVRAAGGRLVGAVTAGAVGDVTEFDLGDSQALSFSGQRVVGADGAPIHGRGIRPDVVVRETRRDFAASRDPVLEAALRLPPRGLGLGSIRSRR